MGDPKKSFFNFDDVKLINADVLREELAAEIGCAEKHAKQQNLAKAKDALKGFVSRTQSAVDNMKAVLSQMRTKEAALKKLMVKHRRLCDAFDEDTNPFPLMEFRNNHFMDLCDLGIDVQVEDIVAMTDATKHFIA